MYPELDSFFKVFPIQEKISLTYMKIKTIKLIKKEAFYDSTNREL
jgi:hypothetical protein